MCCQIQGISWIHSARSWTLGTLQHLQLWQLRLWNASLDYLFHRWLRTQLSRPSPRFFLGLETADHLSSIVSWVITTLDLQHWTRPLQAGSQQLTALLRPGAGRLLRRCSL